MYRFIRSLQQRDNKAWDWSRRVTAYLNKLIPDVKHTVYTSKFGQRGIITWMADFEDLNALEIWEQTYMADEGYNKLLNEGADYFVVGTMVDKVLHEL